MPLKENNKAHVNNESTSLSNKTCNREVLMQTLTVHLQNGQKNMPIRCLIDSGSQRSYLTKRIMKHMGYVSTGQEKMVHSLVGGVQETHLHKRYRIYVGILDGTYNCNFEVFDQEKIC